MIVITYSLLTNIFNVFCRIKKESGIEFPDMMFFDDERDHLSEVAHTCLGKFPDMMFFDDEKDHLSEVAHTCLGNAFLSIYTKSKSFQFPDSDTK